MSIPRIAIVPEREACTCSPQGAALLIQAGSDQNYLIHLEKATIEGNQCFTDIATGKYNVYDKVYDMNKIHYLA